jgi:hypothetical protein
MNLYGFITELEGFGLTTHVSTTIDHHVDYKDRRGALTLFIYWRGPNDVAEHVASLPLEPEESDFYEAAKRISAFFFEEPSKRLRHAEAFGCHLRSIGDKAFELKSRLSPWPRT